MADRGRKAHPVSSILIDEWWQEHVFKLHKQRLQTVQKVVDTSEPEATRYALNGAKTAQLKAERQQAIDYENQLLLDKLIKIKSFDSMRVFRPWLARSTFQYGAGIYIDPTTGTKCVDHLNLTAGLSPRSIHSPLKRPSTAPSARTMQSYLNIIDQNSKLLRAITATASVYSAEELQRDAVRNAEHSRRLSKYRGPESARYTPAAPSLLAPFSAPPAEPGAASRRPFSAQAAMMLPPKQRTFAPVQRRSASASRPSPSVQTASAEYGWTVQSSKAAAAAAHQAELAELGVVEEGDAAELIEVAGDSSEEGGSKNRAIAAALGSSAERTNSRGSHGIGPRPGAVHKAGPAAAPLVPTRSPAGESGSPQSSARTASSSGRKSAGAVASPYLQPQSKQHARRTSSRAGSSPAGSVRGSVVSLQASKTLVADEAPAEAAGSAGSSVKALTSAHSAATSQVPQAPSSPASGATVSVEASDLVD